MEKKKKITTIEDLATMVNNGFQANQEQFDKIDARFDKMDDRFDKINGRLVNIEIRMDNLEREVEEIRKHQIAHTIYRDEFEKLQNRVKALEKLLIKQ